MVAEAFEAWLRKTESAARAQAYRKDVEQFLDFHGLAPTHIEQMTLMVPSDITAWRDHLLAHGGRPDLEGNPTAASNATVSRKITALRSFFSFLQVGGYRGAGSANFREFAPSPR
ncbi:MAG: site-specific integrase [Pirellulaceae bacterium]